MAFATKYQCDFYDYEDNAWHVYFQEDGFGGSVTNFTPGADPVHIHWDTSDKFQTIVGSYCDIQMVYDSDMDTMYTEESQTIKVLVVKGATTKWTGFLSPGQYYRQFNKPVHYATFTASDGLGELKYIKFRDGSDDPYYYPQTELTAITNILAKTGLTLNLVESVNIYEDDFDSTSGDSPLDQTYFFPERYWDEVTGESADCYTVLTDILKKYGARISFNNNNTWFVDRINSIWVPTIRYRTYASGVYQSDTTAAFYNTLTALDAVYLNGDAELSKSGSIGSAVVTLSPQVRSNQIPNGSFEDFTWSGGVPRYWTEVSGSHGGINYNNTADTTAITIGSNQQASLPSYYIYTTFYVNKVESAKLTMNFRAVYTGSPTNATIIIVVKYGTGLYYTNAGWVSSAYPTSTGFQYDLISDSRASMTEFDDLVIDFDPPYGDNGWWKGGLIEVRLYQFFNETPGGETTNYYQVRSLIWETSYMSSFYDKKTYTFDGPNSINLIREEDINTGDSFNLDFYDGYDDTFYGITTDAAGTGNETYAWWIYGDNSTTDTPITIASLLAKQYVEAAWRSNDIIRCTLRGAEDYLGLIAGFRDTEFTDEYGFVKTYAPLSLDWNLREVIWQGEWIEVAPYYNDSALEWTSSDYDTYTITANEIEVDSSAGDGTATFEDYAAVEGEVLRLILVLTNDGSSDLPSFEIEGDAQTIAFGTNLIEYYVTAAGNITCIIGGDDPGDTHNYTATLDLYYLTGV